METKKPKSNVIGWTIGIIMAIFIAITVVFYLTNMKEDDEVGRLKRNVELANQKIVHYQNRVGELTAEVEAKSYTQREMKKFEAETFKRIEEIAGDVKAVKQYVKFKSSARDTVFIKHDSIVYIVDNTGKPVDSLPFAFRDKYMSLNGKYTPKGTFLDYNYTPSYEVVATWKKPEGKGMFAKNRLMVNVVAENPKEIITEAESIEVMVPRKSILNSKAFWSGIAYAIGVLTKLLIK